MKPKKISFYGLFGQQNLGNDCTLQAILHHFRKQLPDAELMCICTGPDEISARYNITAFPLRVMSGKVQPRRRNLLLRLLRKIFISIPKELFHWIKALQTLKGNQMLIVPGTGLLVDHTTGPFGFPYYVFKWSIIAKLCRCKLLFVSVGAGPIYQPLSRWFIKFALSSAYYRSYRDSFSKQYISSIGFNAINDPVYPDLAFSLPRAIMPGSNNCDRKSPVIGVGLIDYRGQHNQSSVKHGGGGEAVYSDYINKLGTFVISLFEDKYTVRVLIGDVQYDSSVKQDLYKLLERRGIKFEEGKLINEPILTIEQLLPQLAKSDVVVSPRFHNIILALMLNKPVLSISYNEKFDALMDGMGLGEYCQNINDIDVSKLIKQVSKLQKNGENLKLLIKRKTEEYRRALDEQYTTIFDEVMSE